MVAEVAILLAAERSGTHLFRSIMSNVDGVSAPAEICNGAGESEISFFQFRQHECLRNPALFSPDPATQAKLLDDYLGTVRKTKSARRLILLDIKYSHVHNFNYYWWDFFNRPYLLDYAAGKKIKIIHLIRKKLARTAISAIYARESGVYRAEHPDETVRLRIAIGRKELEERILRLSRTIRLFEDWLAPGCEHTRISYENLTENSGPMLRRLGKFLNIPGSIPVKPWFVKTTPPYEESISNYDEIKDLIDIKYGDPLRALGGGETGPRSIPLVGPGGRRSAPAGGLLTNESATARRVAAE